jgi:Spy/CpxP family protein refolding chaperone
MKLNRTLGLLLVAGATVCTGAALAAQSAPPPASNTNIAQEPEGGHRHHHRHGMLIGVMLRATRQLDLTPEQQDSIRTILSNAQAQHQAGAAGRPDLAALANPGDPNHAAAVESVRAAAAARFQSEMDVQQQIYDVLSADQKARLPQVLSEMQSKARERRALWQQQHSAAEDGGSN